MSLPDPPRRSVWPLALVLIALIIGAVVFAIFLRLESWPARTAARTTAELERLGRDLRDGFVQVTRLQPRITVHDRVVFEQTTAAAELITASRATEIEHDFTHTWAGSTKRLRLRGRFKVKAGFDLRENFSVTVEEEAIRVQVPPARILGLDQEALEVLEFESGFWNRISAADLEKEITALGQLAREKAEAAGLPREAEAALQKQLEEKLQPARPMRVLFGARPPAG